MQHVRRFGRLTLSLPLLALVLAQGACVVAIGNDRYESSGATGAKFRLAGDEYDSLPVIQNLSDLPTIERRHAAELSRLGPDTTLDQFRALFPTAQFVERRELKDPARVVDAYALRLEERYRYRGQAYGYIARDEKWFYFENGKLVKRGEPRQFP